MTITIDGTTGIASVDASASTPSIRGTDSNSGIFYSADAIKFSTGGTQRAIIDNNGLSATDHIIQVRSDNVNTQATSSATSYAEITSAMRATITPKLATSKLLITFNLSLRANTWMTTRIMKDGTSSVYEDATGFDDASSRSNAVFYEGNYGVNGIYNIELEETAGSTTERYYTPFWYTYSPHKMALNRWTTGNDNYGSTSSWQITEVAA